jgi:hypothetical protein
LTRLFCYNNDVLSYNSVSDRSKVGTMTEFSRTAAVVATSIQNLVQNVYSMQRMLIHLDTHVEGLRQLQHYTGQLARYTAIKLKQLAESQPPGDSWDKLQIESKLPGPGEVQSVAEQDTEVHGRL